MIDIINIKKEIFIYLQRFKKNMAIKTKRKLIRQGGGGLTIYVPKKWIDKNELNSGQLIDVDEEENILKLSVRGSKINIKEKEITIKDEDSPRIRTMLSSLYRRGYDKITLNSKNPIPFVEINKIIDSLMGFVVVEQSSKKVVVKNLMSENFEETPNIINKMFITTKYFMSEMIGYLKNNEMKEIELRELKTSIIRLRDYCQRMIHISNFDKDKRYEYYNLIYIIEKISGNFIDFLRYRTLKKIDIELLEKSLQLFSESYKIYSEKKFENAVKFNKKTSNFKKEVHKSKNNTLLPVIAENIYALSSRIVSITV